MAYDTFAEFMDNYAGGDNADRVIVDLNLDARPDKSLSPFIIVRHGPYVLVLNPMAPGADHMCVDAHAFVDGIDAKTGVLAIDSGARLSLQASQGTSHGWPAAAMVSFILGEQAEVTNPSRTKEIDSDTHPAPR